MELLSHGLITFHVPKIVLQQEIKFIKYVVCHQCHSLYDELDCVMKSGTNLCSKKCHFVPFPNDPMAAFRKQCDRPLMYAVERSKVQFKPYKIYAYQSLRDAVSHLLRRQGFLEKCELWKEQQRNPDFLFDVYDGKVWKDFSSFLSQPHS